MDGAEHPAKVALRLARDAAIDRLSHAFATDQLGLVEFEERVDAAFRCHTAEDLVALVADLTGPPVQAETAVVVAGTAVVVARETALAVPADRPAIVSVLGNVERRGRFALEDRTRVLSVLGNVELDLRDVVFPPGVTHIHVRSILGNIEITVPPHLPVECEGTGVLGSFTSVNRVPAADEAGPRLRVTGLAVLGNVEVHTRPRATVVGALEAAHAPRALPPKR